MQPLPAGASLSDGVFTWQTGAGVLGSFDMVFDTPDGSRVVRIVVRPGAEASWHVAIDAPFESATVPTSFLIGGWAIDQDASDGSGIDAVHVWAYPASGERPVFLGPATLDGVRPDVAQIYGERFREGGFGLQASLPPGQYSLAVFARSRARGMFLPARTVSITVR